jgi:hypothetical protein
VVLSRCSLYDHPQLGVMPANGMCEVVAFDYSLPRLRLGIDPGVDKKGTLKSRTQQALRGLPAQDRKLFELVEDLRDAQWVVRLGKKALELAEASGNRPGIRLPDLDNDTFGEVLADKLRKMYRARSLVAVGTRLEMERSRGAAGGDIQIDVIRHKVPSDKGEVVPRPSGGWVFRPGDWISFRVTNKSESKRLDVTLLVIDPDYKIHVFYPARGEVGKSLDPGKSLETEAGEISDQPPFGPENMIALSTRAVNPPVDFSLLAQPGVRERAGTIKSPLGELLERSMFGVGDRSGLARSQVEEQGARVLNWRTEPRSAKK